MRARVRARQNETTRDNFILKFPTLRASIQEFLAILNAQGQAPDDPHVPPRHLKDLPHSPAYWRFLNITLIRPEDPRLTTRPSIDLLQS
jgi:hypothetical protein